MTHICRCPTCAVTDAVCHFEHALVDLLEERDELRAIIRSLRARLATPRPHPHVTPDPDTP